MADEQKSENIDTPETSAPAEPEAPAAEPAPAEAAQPEEKPAEAAPEAPKEDAKPEKEAAPADDKKDDKSRVRGGRRGRRPRQEKPREQKEFDEVVLQIDRVSRMMKGGRRMSFRASVVIGDRKSRVGFGMAKANEVQGAIQKAVREARKNMITLPLKDGRTIPHRIDHKFKAARLRIISASEGTGVIAGGTIRAILELGGVKDCLSKNIGTNNKVTIAKGTIQALQSFRG